MEIYSYCDRLTLAHLGSFGCMSKLLTMKPMHPVHYPMIIIHNSIVTYIYIIQHIPYQIHYHKKSANPFPQISFSLIIWSQKHPSIPYSQICRNNNNNKNIGSRHGYYIPTYMHIVFVLMYVDQDIKIQQFIFRYTFMDNNILDAHHVWKLPMLCICTNVYICWMKMLFIFIRFFLPSNSPSISFFFYFSHLYVIQILSLYKFKGLFLKKQLSLKNVI